RHDEFNQRFMEMEAEERVLELIDEGKMQLQEIGEDIEESVDTGAIYSIALWELLKSNFSDLERKEAFETARSVVDASEHTHPSSDSVADRTTKSTDTTEDDDDTDDDGDEVTVGEIDTDKEWHA
ncbi:MAG: hypothetical protein ABEI52_05235, partial [Halobacteriaceae archaeon]